MSSIASTNLQFSAATDLPERLADALRETRRRPSPDHSRSPGGIRGAVRMSPQLSYGRHAGPAPPTARRAAVLVLLFRRGREWHVPLTERPRNLTRHGGQISLPGGALEPEERSSDAALRELSEELGISRGVELLGRLANCYVFASDFVVTPWLAVSRDEPHWQPHDDEVQHVIELPLRTLLEDAAIGRTTIQRGPLVFHAPCIQFGGACIWGATAVMLGELAEVLRRVEVDG